MDTCKNCKFFNVTHDVCDEHIPVFECRFHAPQQVAGVGSGYSNQLWAHVSPDDWCGEFKPDASSNPDMEALDDTKS